MQREPAARQAVCRYRGACPSVELRWEHCVWEGDERTETEDAGLRGEAQVKAAAAKTAVR